MARDSKRDRGMPIREYKGRIGSKMLMSSRRDEGGATGWNGAIPSDEMQPVQGSVPLHFFLGSSTRGETLGFAGLTGGDPDAETIEAD